MDLIFRYQPVLHYLRSAKWDVVINKTGHLSTIWAFCDRKRVSKRKIIVPLQ